MKPYKALLILALLPLLAGGAFGQEVKSLPWPAANAWGNTCPHASWCWHKLPSIGEPLLQAKTAYVQSDLPAAFAVPPSAFSNRFTVVVDPLIADIQVFVRAGSGGPSMPDIAVFLKGGQLAFARTEQRPVPPSPSTADAQCLHFPYNMTTACALLNLGNTLTEGQGAQSYATSWDVLIHVLEQAQKDAEKTARKAQKKADKAAREAAKR